MQTVNEATFNNVSAGQTKNMLNPSIKAAGETGGVIYRESLQTAFKPDESL